jgi:hypothetical protein
MNIFKNVFILTIIISLSVFFVYGSFAFDIKKPQIGDIAGEHQIQASVATIVTDSK